uniref:Uncharacterized protein n=1 Tax=Schizaphis graminum TaxID=13262 RepID=A0A2S2PBF7_SCHGA
MSVTSTESKLADHKYVLGRYLYYKTLSKDLLKCNEEHEQELHMTKNKLELKNLELNDAMSHLEEKSKEIENMMLEMKNLKTAMNKMKNAYKNVEEENKIFSSEIIDLKSKLCDSWWCPKHSDLLKISKELKIKTIKDKVKVHMALKRQKY